MSPLRERAFAALRELAYLGARHGPSWWLRHSPDPIGALAAALTPARRRAVEARLSWVLGRTPHPEEVRATFVNFAHCLAESLAVGGHESVVRAVAPAGLRERLESSRGVVLLTAHTGAWELAARQFRREFTREVVLVMRAEPNARARAVHERVRRAGGVRVAYVDDDPFLALRLADELRQNRALAFQMDREAPSGRAIAAQLFGRAWSVPRGPLALARATGAPIVTAFAAREAFLSHTLELHPPVALDARCSAEQLQQVAQGLVSQFEEFLRRYPTQWFHFGELSPPSAIGGSPSATGWATRRPSR